MATHINGETLGDDDGLNVFGDFFDPSRSFALPTFDTPWSHSSLLPMSTNTAPTTIKVFACTARSDFSSPNAGNYTVGLRSVTQWSGWVNPPRALTNACTIPAPHMWVRSDQPKWLGTPSPAHRHGYESSFFEFTRRPSHARPTIVQQSPHLWVCIGILLGAIFRTRLGTLSPTRLVRMLVVAFSIFAVEGVQIGQRMLCPLTCIHFLQDSASVLFKNGKTVTSLAYDLLDSLTDPLDVEPIRVILIAGLAFVLDHRRLVAFALANHQAAHPIPVHVEIAGFARGPLRSPRDLIDQMSCYVPRPCAINVAKELLWKAGNNLRFNCVNFGAQTIHLQYWPSDKLCFRTGTWKKAYFGLFWRRSICRVKDKKARNRHQWQLAIKRTIRKISKGRPNLERFRYAPPERCTCGTLSGNHVTSCPRAHSTRTFLGYTNGETR